MPREVDIVKWMRYEMCDVVCAMFSEVTSGCEATIRGAREGGRHRGWADLGRG